jgi:hypothetical protein
LTLFLVGREPDSLHQVELVVLGGSAARLAGDRRLRPDGYKVA